MKEVRALLTDLEPAKKKCLELGAEFVDHYAFTDHVFTSGEGILKIRVLTLSDKPKKVILAQKKAVFEGDAKTDIIKRKEFFETYEEAFATVGNEWQKKVEFSREGWGYELGGVKIYIEDLEKLGPSVEIEFEEQSGLLKEFDVTEVLGCSLPERFMQ